MKTYTLSVNPGTMVPSTPTVVAFLQSAYHLKKHGQDVFTGLDVMKHALDKNLWTTKQSTDKQLMTTWAFYLKTLKSIGFTEHGSIGHNGTRKIDISELLELDDEE